MCRFMCSIIYVILLSGMTGFSSPIVHYGGFRNLKFYNNTIISNSLSVALFRSAEGTFDSLSFINNITDMAQGASAFFQCATVPGNSRIRNSLFNNCALEGDLDTSRVFYGKADLAGGTDETGRYRPLSIASNVVDAGIVINGYADRYEGAAPDIGAYEFIPSAAPSPYTVAPLMRVSAKDVSSSTAMFDLRGRMVPSHSNGRSARMVRFARTR